MNAEAQNKGSSCFYARNETLDRIGESMSYYRIDGQPLAMKKEQE